jgi:radical SAM enzyme (TIGR01210 family)
LRSTPEELTAAWPETARERDRFVLDRRPLRPQLDPDQPGGVIVEDERTETGAVGRMGTLFLTGAECPWRCVMCDLWKHTVETATVPGALPRQLDAALERLAPLPPRLKLYNAGSFFDPNAVPVAEYAALAGRLQGFEQVVVESHPALVGERVERWQAALGSVALEVAMGLETAHPGALERLHKRMTLEQFAVAAAALRRRGASVRAFVLVPPPFVARHEEADWLRRSIDFAFESGVGVVSLVPTRLGNGALDALNTQGAFRAPRLRDLEQALEAALPEPRGRVFADLWDLAAFSDCDACLEARRERLHAMNLRQEVLAPVACGRCA